MTKDDLDINAIKRNLSQLPPEEQQKLYKGIRDVPAKQIFEQVQYLDQVMLPKIAEKRGVESEDYKFYKSVADSLLWAIHIIDRYEFLQTRYLTACMQSAFWQDLNVKYEKELSKYTTLEDLMFTSSLDAYNESVKQRAETLKKEKQ